MVKVWSDVVYNEVVGSIVHTGVKSKTKLNRRCSIIIIQVKRVKLHGFKTKHLLHLQT